MCFAVTLIAWALVRLGNIALGVGAHEKATSLYGKSFLSMGGIGDRHGTLAAHNITQPKPVLRFRPEISTTRVAAEYIRLDWSGLTGRELFNAPFRLNRMP